MKLGNAGWGTRVTDDNPIVTRWLRVLFIRRVTRYPEPHPGHDPGWESRCLAISDEHSAIRNVQPQQRHVC
jgi:hypothetical protein